MEKLIVVLLTLVAMVALDGYLVMIGMNASGHNISYENACVIGIAITGLIGSGSYKGTTASK